MTNTMKKHGIHKNIHEIAVTKKQNDKFNRALISILG